MSLMDEWLASTSFDETYDGGIPPLDPEPDDPDDDEGDGDADEEPETKAASGTSRIRRRSIEREFIVGLETYVETALRNYWREQRELVRGRLRGRKARMGTRHWTPAHGGAPVVTKTLDADYILPGNLDREMAEEYARALALYVASEAFGKAREEMGAASLDASIDSPLVQQQIDQTVITLLGITGDKAALVRARIIEADFGEGTLDDVLAAVDDLYDEAEGWAGEAARTQVTKMVNRAALLAAKAAGAVTKDWLSVEDDNVRETHRIADASDEVGIDEKFVVGGFRLDHPGDDSDWPASAGEVANCRCTMIFGLPETFASFEVDEELDPFDLRD